MRLLLLLLLLVPAVAPAAEEAEGPPRYKRFPETISPDDAYFLAWGHKLPADGDPGSLIEVGYTVQIKPAVNEIQDYLVDTKHNFPPLPLPKFEYFAGSEGHEDQRGLTFAWSPDSTGVFILYEGEGGYLSASWVSPVERKVTALGAQLEKDLRSLVSERFGRGEEKARTNVFFSRIAVIRPGLLTLDGCLTQLTSRIEKPASFWFRMRYRITQDENGIRAEMIKNHILLPDDLLSEAPTKKSATLEEQLGKAILSLMGKLDGEGKEALKKEQVLWGKQRDALANSWNRAGFTKHRLEELQIRASEPN